MCLGLSGPEDEGSGFFSERGGEQRRDDEEDDGPGFNAWEVCEQGREGLNYLTLKITLICSKAG